MAAHSLAMGVVLLLGSLIALTASGPRTFASGGEQAPVSAPATKASSQAQATAEVPQETQAGFDLRVTVTDENGLVVPAAHITLRPKVGGPVMKGESDYAGWYTFTDLAAGSYSVLVEKEGYYAVTHQDLRVGEVENIDITLNRVKEFSEVVNVVYSPPAIDPAKTSSTETLSSQDIINIPYTVTRDIRYALPLLPGVLQDGFGQLHVDGSSTRQIYDQLDGFNVTDPVTGLFNMRVSVDAVQSAEVKSSRYSTEYGKGSGGVIDLRTTMGDDHYRFLATDFLPSFQSRKGLNINTWTPRGVVSGPLRKGRAWFMDALEGEYDLNIIKELPDGADRNLATRFSNLFKTQVNLTPANILTTDFLLNGFQANHAGLSPFDPVETTLHETELTYLVGVKDQHLFTGGTLLETGVAYSRFNTKYDPMGDQTYILTPDGSLGNYYQTNHSHATRTQALVNLFVPPLYAMGRHEFKVGLDLDRLTDDQSFERRPMVIEREDGTVSRRIAFTDVPPFGLRNFEAGVYAQDRWWLSGRWLVEPGVRFDRDDLVGEVVASPRVASTLMLSENGNSKLSAGVGIYRDASNLDLYARTLSGQRVDSFYDSTGEVQVGPPVETTFRVDPSGLKFPRVLNWSVGLEQKLPEAVYVQVQFLQKRGHNEWTFINAGIQHPGELSGDYVLSNYRRDRYDALQVGLRRAFKGNHLIFVSYTRSRAYTNANLNFNFGYPVFSPQVAGPLAWDTPNRFQSWGWLPFIWETNLGYSLDWRNGFPITLFNEDQQVVGPPGSRRFPNYFSLNIMLERRFRFFGFEWALRGGFDNITNTPNPTFVDSNVDSPHFMTFSGIQGRVLNGRLRLLGRK